MWLEASRDEVTWEQASDVNSEMIMEYEKDIMNNDDPATKRLRIDTTDRECSRETADLQRFVQVATYIVL